MLFISETLPNLSGLKNSEAMNSKLLVELIPLSCAELDSVSAGSWVKYPDAQRRNI